MAAPASRLAASGAAAALTGGRRLAAIRLANPPGAARRNLLTPSSSSGPVFHKRVGSVKVPLSSHAPTRRCLASSPVGQEEEEEEDANLISLPPNLKIDPKSTCSPVYGLRRVGLGGGSAAPADDEVEAAEEPAADAKETGGVKYEIPEDLLDSDDEEEGEDSGEEYADGEVEQWFDLTDRPQPIVAVPLPDRLHVPILDIKDASEVGTIYLSEQVFGMNPIRPDLLHRVVVWQRNRKRGKRNPGARTKTISEVSGSGRKVRRQKGSGQARAGHRRPAHWRGGAKAHGPKGRIQDYTTKLNKKVRKQGLCHALSQKLKEGNLIVASDLALETHKTKVLAAMLDKFDIGGRYGATAFVLDEPVADEDDKGGEHASVGGVNVNFKVASGNLYKVKVVNQLGANVYDILKHEKLIMSLEALGAIEERLTKIIPRS